MSELLETLKKGLKEMGIEITESQLECFQLFYRLIVEENKKNNITAIVDEQEFAVKHFIDSLTCLKAGMFNDGMKLMDIGTGAGFPGIPLKICRPGLEVVLIESQAKKVKFLLKVIRAMDLKNISAMHTRAEEIGRKTFYRGYCDLVTARAVAELRVLAEYCLPVVKIGGFFLAMKGPKLFEELAAAEKAVNILGGEIAKIIKLNLPVTGDERNLVVVKKIKPTPEKYPRRPGVPLKKPV
ncbi:16S rRNA (guanine(527)-N(7))-methyltransferase RsmG [Pelotomaculum terephthalicicum JT]|uniref:16S rRNA (guanine(527)-N(7))-methyltransferase RsmG n=1 Tax=Pelotomaculum terephthalicicum TaxID=206393 RepID=UPI001F03B793|nr:16S rRNA (guanine(527)-N(7))-methyltransferase RsmG [Pelotomaculum terephthalicicum]MCG9966856.1 16S rRNA (guanine(527)-N(7))-methyltransferase RsmG [Pelotomaculum terephthalicicum JT]